DGDPIALAFEVPYVKGAIHIALATQRFNEGKKKNKGKTLLIFDEQTQFERKVEDLIGVPPDFLAGFYHDEGAVPLDQIIDTALFVQSHYSYFIQIADTIAFVSRRFVELESFGAAEGYVGERARITAWFAIIRFQNLSRGRRFIRRPP